MKENRKGFILPLAEATRGGAPKEGSSKVEFCAFLHRVTDPPGGGKEHSMHTRFDVYMIQPGGGVEEHYHEPPVIDHVSYVISGRVRVTIGDIEKIVGADTLIYCPSNVMHSVKNVGKTVAKVLRMSGSAEGKKMGVPVYSKKPSGELGVREWKLASSEAKS